MRLAKELNWLTPWMSWLKSLRNSRGDSASLSAFSKAHRGISGTTYAGQRLFSSCTRGPNILRSDTFATIKV